MRAILPMLLAVIVLALVDIAHARPSARGAYWREAIRTFDSNGDGRISERERRSFWRGMDYHHRDWTARGRHEIKLDAVIREIESILGRIGAEPKKPAQEEKDR